MSQANRVETMAVKLSAYAERAGADARSIEAAYQAAVRHRLAQLGSVFHYDLLHPARTALILLEDAGCSDSTVLTAAALCESEFPALRIAPAQLNPFDSAVRALVAFLPLPTLAGDELLERLLVAPDEVGLIAVAERLDHARHLHFRAAEHWRPFFEQVTHAYMPCASRISPPIARRFSSWHRAFERRFLTAS